MRTAIGAPAPGNDPDRDEFILLFNQVWPTLGTEARQNLTKHLLDLSAEATVNRFRSIDAVEKIMRLEEELDNEVIEPGEAYSAIAQILGVPYVNLAKASIDSAAIELVPEETCRRHTVIPVKRDVATNVLWVAMADVSTPNAVDDLKLVSRCTIRAALADPEQIRAAIDRCYPKTD